MQVLARFAYEYPFASFALCLLAVALPFIFSGPVNPARPCPPWVRWYRRTLVAAGIGLAVTAAVRYLVAAQPAVEGVDFYFYLCFGRDLLHGVPDPALSKYAYFPGGFRIWEFAMAVLGEDLSTLRAFFVCTLALNALLCWAIVARCVKCASAGALAGLWYLVLASRFEGLDGTTEPFSTAFALAGVLAWGGQPLRGSTGWTRALLLGAALGLAAWVKQQGGLVAIGVGVLAVAFVANRSASRDEFRQILAIPAAALTVLILAILLEGHGLQPLFVGLRAVEEYATLGAFAPNVARMARLGGLAGWFALVTLYLWLALLAAGIATGERQAPWASIVGFSLVASLATLPQFAKRDIPHYVLLAAPFLSIAVSIMAIRSTQAAAAAWPRLGPFVAIATAGVLALPAVDSMLGAGRFQVWPVVWNPVVSVQEPWHHESDIALDLKSLAAQVTPGEDILILPPRRNAIHFLLGTRSLSNPHGYGWGPDDAKQSISTPSLKTVLVLDPRTFEPGETATCKSIECSKAIAALPEYGYRIVSAQTSMTLWRRP